MAGLFGLFNYEKEGPGVAKNAPKKRAFFAFMDIFSRKFWKLAIAGLLYTAVSLPVVTRGWAAAGLTRITRSFSREKHAFIKEDFFETIKKNRKSSLLIGLINLIVTGVLLYNIVIFLPNVFPHIMVLFNWSETQIAAIPELSTFETILLAASLLLYITFTWMKYYIPFLLITFKLSIKQIYKNAFLFAAGNVKVNLLISVILAAIYAVLGAAVLFTANTPTNYLVATVVLALGVSIIPGFRSLLIQYSIFPAIKKTIIDPYYEQNPDADKQARYDLNLEVAETPAATTAEGDAVPPTNEEEDDAPIFTDTLPVKEEAPKKALPKQYNEKELRHFNRQVRSRTDDDDDDTI